MNKTSRHRLLWVQVLLLALLAVIGGCDRQDNDWSMYKPDLKLVHISADTLYVDETGGAASFTVNISMVPDDTVFVYPSSQYGQLVFLPDSLIFAPVEDEWLTLSTIEVTALDDNVEEGPHQDQVSFQVKSRDSVYDGQVWDLSIPVMLTDNDQAHVAVSETLLTLVESDLGAVFTSYRLVLNSEPTAPVTVTPTVVPAEPTLHLDPGAVIFDASNWNLEQVITLWIELDGVNADPQSLVIEHSSDSADSNYSSGLAIAPVYLEIFDDTLTPVVTLTPAVMGNTLAEASVEGYGVVLSLSLASAVPLVIHLATVDGAAVGGTDFTVLDQDVTFLPGDPLTQSFTIMSVDDAILEDTENFQVVITADPGVIVGAEDRLEIFIIDDDLVTVTLATTPVNEDSGAAEYVVTIPDPAEFPIAFTFFTADGSALAGQDYVPVNSSFILQPGETSHTIPVVIHADSVYETDETLTGALTELSANALWSGVPVECTILNDDPQNISFADITHHETDGTAVFTIDLLRPYPDDVNLVVNTLDGDGLGTPTDEVDALADSDYTPAAGVTWTIPAGLTSSTFSIPVTNDLQAEATLEYFRLEITSASHAGFAGLVARCTLIDDQQPCVAVADVTVQESGGTAIFTLRLLDETGAPTTSAADVVLQVATVDQTATAGDDYVAVSGTYIIPHGQPSLDVAVSVNDDVHDDDNEVFILLVSDPVNALGNCDAEPAFCAIIDDEFPSINIESALTRVNEGSSFTFNIHLTTQRQTATTFDLALLPGTSNGQGVDYTFAQNGSQTVPPYTDYITFTVPVLDDQLEGEADETVLVTIANANCALGVVALEATMVDAPELSITGDSVLEGATAYFTVTADAPSTADMHFSVQHSSGTAVSGLDFSDANTGPFTIPAGQTTVQVPVVTASGDGGDNALEDFFVTIVSPVNATNSPFNSALGHITDGDPPQLYWAGTASAVEGNAIILRVNLSWLSTASVQFSVQYTDGTAARLGIDYDDSAGGPFTVAPGNLFYLVSVPTTADGIPELLAEDFTVTLNSPVNSVLGSPVTTTGFVLDGDQPELSFQLDQTADEGADLTFTVQLSQVSTVPVTFTIQYDNGSTQGAEDFDASNTGPFTIAAGGTTATVVVGTVDDAVMEGPEAFIIRIANPVNAVRAVDFEASGAITDND